MEENLDMVHRQGRGEMKFEVFQEIEQLIKEFDLNPDLSEEEKQKFKRGLLILKNRMQKL